MMRARSSTIDRTGGLFSGAGTSRGTVVDLVALANSLHDGHLAGASVDVYPKEPPEPDHPLSNAPMSCSPRTSRG
jgi:lactate dehydrogenase-like 2-hydroxyacid dehydrogenase